MKAPHRALYHLRFQNKSELYDIHILHLSRLGVYDKQPKITCEAASEKMIYHFHVE